MLKKILTLCLILSGIGFLYFGYIWFEDQQWKAELQRDFGPDRNDELAQKNALLALGDLDLNPSDLTLALLRQKLREPELKQAGDFNSTRLGWACAKARCAIIATFFVPFGQEISPATTPAGLVISGSAFGDFHNIAVGGVHLGESDEKLVELDQYHKFKSSRKFHTVKWDRDWDVAWAGVGRKASILAFSNVTLQHRFVNERNVAAHKPTK